MVGPSQAECFCTIPNIPSFTRETAPSMSIFGSSRNRSYETISSVFLVEQVAAILNSLARSGHITEDKANDAAIIYGNLLNNGLEAVVQIFCSTEGIKEKAAHLDHDIRKFGERLL
ncbi:hypothetical protein TSUD_319460 [Trifolium subterraneum]|uniref:Uncharacterized protein n=1 Tax=Trifolium subterraneum TaxID=3900 RepID=A0A2Z6MZA1_TRISU|nr:hypothetical protein TSUD_319460 [Trifolium subterraneum]